MKPLIQYRTMFMPMLLQMLKEEGIVISTATILDIDKILVNIDSAFYPPFSKLKFLLTPVISRNKEEQEIIYEVFDRLDEKVNIITQSLPPARPPKRNWKKFLWLVPAAIIISYAIYWLAINNIPAKLSGIKAGYEQEMVIGDTISFSAQLMDSTDTKNTYVNWIFNADTLKEQWQVSRIFTDTGSLSVTALLFSKENQLLDSISNSYYLLCEHTPSASIIKLADTADAGAKRKRSKINYIAEIQNASADSNRYVYNWLVNDTLVNNNNKPALSLPELSKGSRNIKLLVQRTGAHCGSDTLPATLNDMPAVSVNIRGKEPLQLSSSLTWNNILLSLFFLLLLPALAGFLVYKLIFNSFIYKEDKPTRADTRQRDEPYNIAFNNRENIIHSQQEIEQLADVLRKRQVGDTYKLDIRKTIQSAFKTGGLPELKFTPLTKPTEVLVLIDKENPDSHLVKLFEYLINRLQAEQVNIVVYDYYKEPLYLTNEKLNHIHIPVDRVAALYPDTALFIFGDARHFVLTLKGTLKSWVNDKLAAWETKLLITPFAKNDWDKKERLLAEAKFIIIPADASAYHLIEKIVYRQVDHFSSKKPAMNGTYEARFLNFNELPKLKEYLNDNHLFKWVCCLAVYPDTDWNFTLAIGHALEKKLQKEEPDIELVNYTNLLKISRISWLNDSLITDSIKVEMLKELDNETEALARETLMNLLDEISGSISPTSLVKRQHQVLEQVNNFLVKSYNGQRHTRQEKTFISNVLKKGHLDSANSIYLDTGDDTLLKNPRGGNESVTPDDYFKMSSATNRIRSLTGGISAFLSLAVLGYFLIQSISPALFTWNKTAPSTLSFILNKNGINLQPNLHAKMGTDNQPVLTFSADTVTLDNVFVTDTTQKVVFTISDENNIVSSDSIQLNSASYIINFSEAAVVPLTMYYNTPVAKQLAENIINNLPLYFDVTEIQRDFTDTTIKINYTDAVQLKDAQTLSAVISEQTGKNITPVSGITQNNQQTTASIEIFVGAAGSCTVVPVSALPESLNEIWHGGIGTNLLNINLQKQGMYYYSPADVATNEMYRINEICLNPKGGYRIIAQTSKGYKLFFIRNITPQSFFLSVCKGLYKSKQELDLKTEANCEKYYLWALYYEKYSSTNIYLPVMSSKLISSEKTKLDTKSDSLKTGKFDYNMVEYVNNSSLPKFNTANINQYLTQSNISYAVSRANVPLNLKTVTINSPNPFQRNYLVVNLTPVKQEIKYPDCSRTFTSVDEVKKEESPLIVCKLDLSKSNLSAMPKEVYDYTNMQQLILGTTNIPQAEIDQLQKALAKCKIDYTIYQAPKQNKETLLGTVSFDKKDYITSASQQLIEQIAQQLKADQSRKIKIQASYGTDAERKKLDSYINSIEDIFLKLGVSVKTGQLETNITQQQQQQKQQQSNAAPLANIIINLIGINFPELVNDKKSAN